MTLTARHVDDTKVTDHHAIIPTEQRVDPVALSPDEKRLYDLIVRRFLAALYPDAVIERTTILTAVEGERFTTGAPWCWRPAGARWTRPPGTGRLPTTMPERLRSCRGSGSMRRPRHRAETLRKHTKAPPRYSDATLLGAMETAGKQMDDDELRLAMKDTGLGTPATRAAIIETLLKREYVRREQKALVATAKGMALITMLRSPLLTSAELTGQWEQKLARMVRGEYARETFMQEVRAMVADLVAQIAGTAMEPSATRSSVQTRGAAPRPAGALDCPQCVAEGRAGGFLIERVGAHGPFLVCAIGTEACGFITDKPKNASSVRPCRRRSAPSARARCGCASRKSRGRRSRSPAATLRTARGYAGSTAKAPWSRCAHGRRRDRPARSAARRP